MIRPEGGFMSRVDDLAMALANVDFKKPVVLLSHQPDIFDKAKKRVWISSFRPYPCRPDPVRLTL